MAPKATLSFPPTLYSAKLVGASDYRFQIAPEESFASVEFDKTQDTNIFTPSTWTPSNGASTYYFRVIAKKDGILGTWSAGQVFTITSIPTTTTTTIPSTTTTTTIPPTGTVSSPSFSPTAGTYSTTQSISLSTNPSDATIRYTIDGSTPTETTGTVYTGAISVSSTKTIKAIAYKAGWTASPVSSATYTITGTVATPTFSPIAGTYTTAQNVTISCSLAGSSIRYTTDGTNPSSTSGTLYTGSITISSTCIIKAVAYKTDWITSNIENAIYTLTLPSLNIALSSAGATATAISEGTYLGTTQYALKAIDGDAETGWSSEWDMPAWLLVQFNNTYKINKIGVWWGSHQHNYTIKISINGTSWTTVRSGTSNNVEGAAPIHEEFSISPQYAKYIKIEITSTSAPSSHIFQASVNELEVYAGDI